MSRRRRIVFDTSTLVSAALRVGSVPHQSLFKAIEECRLCVSRETLAELETVLGRSKFDRYAEQEIRGRFFTVVREAALLVDVSNSESAAFEQDCRDLTDIKFLALAAAAEADALISSDQDLLVLHPWRGITIITPAAFVSRSGPERLRLSSL